MSVTSGPLTRRRRGCGCCHGTSFDISRCLSLSVTGSTVASVPSEIASSRSDGAIVELGAGTCSGISTRGNSSVSAMGVPSSGTGDRSATGLVGRYSGDGTSGEFSASVGTRSSGSASSWVGGRPSSSGVFVLVRSTPTPRPPRTFSRRARNSFRRKISPPMASGLVACRRCRGVHLKSLPDLPLVPKWRAELCVRRYSFPASFSVCGLLLGRGRRGAHPLFPAGAVQGSLSPFRSTGMEQKGVCSGGVGRGRQPNNAESKWKAGSASTKKTMHVRLLCLSHDSNHRTCS